MHSIGKERLASEPPTQGFMLTSLPEEILYMISKCVQEPSSTFSLYHNDMSPRSPSLKALSETCQTMRRIASPDLFRAVSIDRLPPVIETKRRNNRQVYNECCQFLSPHTRLLDLKTSHRYSTEGLRLVLQRLLSLLTSLETIVNMPHDVLYAEAVVEAITAHSKLQSVDVSTIPIEHDTHDSRKTGQQLPCLPVFRYHLILPPPPWTVPLYLCFPEVRNPEMRVLSLFLSSVVDDLGLLTQQRRVFPDLATLSLVDVRENDRDRDIALLVAFLTLNPTIEHLEFDGLDLFFAFAQHQSAMPTLRSLEDFPHLKLHSSSWEVPKVESPVLCRKLAIYTVRESEMGESIDFFVDIPMYIPTLRELAIDLGYYVGPSSKPANERLSDVMKIVMPIASSLASLKDLWRIDLHCMMDEEQQRSLTFALATKILSLQVIAFGRGLLQPDRTKRAPPMKVTHIIRDCDGKPVRIDYYRSDTKIMLPGPEIELSDCKRTRGSIQPHCEDDEEQFVQELDDTMVGFSQP